MLSSIYLLKYNNYYNRIIKKYDTIGDYIDNEIVLGSYENINFNSNDGVTSSLVINYDGPNMPDYLIVCSPDGNIESRWYILKNLRNRAGQFVVDLYRDLIADWYSEIISAPCFIEKATVGLNDNAIFNNEDMSFNRIKTSETLLKDLVGCGWYVGYYDNANLTEDKRTISIADPEYYVAETDVYESIEDYPHYGLFNKLIRANVKPEYVAVAFYPYAGGGYFTTAFDMSGNLTEPSYINLTDRSDTPPLIEYDNYFYEPGVITGYRAKANINAEDVVKAIASKAQDKTINWTNIVNKYSPNETTDYNTIMAEDGKIIKVGENLYKLSVVSDQGTFYGYNKVTGGGNEIYDNINSIMTNLTDYIRGETPKFPIGFAAYSYKKYELTYNIIPNAVVSISIPENAAKCIDAPYSMFAIPFGTVSFRSTLDNARVYNNPELAYRLANEMVRSLGKYLYDIQILPYMPLDDSWFKYSSFFEDTMIDAYALNASSSAITYATSYKYPSTDDGVLVLFPENTQFRKRYYTNLINVPTDNVEFKVSNECDMYRLCSPNYNGQFEFSATKNNGVTAWDYSFTYKPFTPYIKVSPEFSRLYGQTYNDARGLVCGGDFSMSQISDAWTNYEIDNKNYQVMFDRQITNMEVNNSVAKTRETISALTGSLSGASSGAIAAGAGSGGNPYAAAAGALVGGAASIIGGIADISLNEKLRKEALDYSRDQFGYSLQNIQAMPYSITKVGTQNIDFKLFPFVEYYTASAIEKNALRDKIKYNGMTVMRISNINNFIDPNKRTYIKGKLIRLETIFDDFNVVNMISKEINEGVFI